MYVMLQIYIFVQANLVNGSDVKCILSLSCCGSSSLMYFKVILDARVSHLSAECVVSISLILLMRALLRYRIHISAWNTLHERT